jgi:hypothetical protein
MAVYATGPANGSFDVDWNMWLKVDGVSVCANDTSNGISNQTFDGTGNWHRSASLSGYWTGGVGTHTAEANATLTVYYNGSTNKGSKTDQDFIVYPVIYP